MLQSHSVTTYNVSLSVQSRSKLCVLYEGWFLKLEVRDRDASFQAKAWIQALAIYFQAICFSFLCTNWTILNSFQAHSCFLTDNPEESIEWTRALSISYWISANFWPYPYQPILFKNLYRYRCKRNKEWGSKKRLNSEYRRLPLLLKSAVT